MSRIGRMPIQVPQGVTIEIQDRRVRVKGPKGEIEQEFDPRISIEHNDGEITVTRAADDRESRALHGLTRALLANMVEGASVGFRKSLEVVGVGYHADMQGNDLVLSVGYIQPVKHTPPPGITFEVEKGNRIVHVMGVDKVLVGNTAAILRKVRPPDVYKGKGIRYVGEQVRHKAGKAGKAAS